MATQNCPTCNKERGQWKERNGQGFTKGNQTYCCRGCAENSGCNC